MDYNSARQWLNQTDTISANNISFSYKNISSYKDFNAVKCKITNILNPSVKVAKDYFDGNTPIREFLGKESTIKLIE